MGIWPPTGVFIMLRMLRIALLGGPAGILIALVLLGSTAAAPGDTVADRVFGQGGSFTSGDCNLGVASSLCTPFGAAVDGAGNLYVADHLNNRVLESDSPLTTDPVADRVFGQASSFTSTTCNLGGVSAGSLCYPTGP